MRRIATIALTLLTAAGCGDPATDGGPAVPDCPVTVPTAAFTPPEGYPAEPATAADGDVWYGTDELFTALSGSGDYRPRKSVWWSTAFPGGSDEERPPLTVTYTSLDTGVVHVHDEATNAYTVEDGWFMIGGIDPDEPGCWRVEATYKGAGLSYVYERP